MGRQIGNYIEQNEEWLVKANIFETLAKKYGTIDFTKWDKQDRFLYDKNITDFVSRHLRISQIADEAGSDFGFFFFKQYLADKHLEMSRKKLNEKGLKLIGDMPCGFSWSEVWANPKAFVDGYSLSNWGLPALDHSSEEARELLREKANIFARRYDGIRVDAAWTYLRQPLKNRNTGIIEKYLDFDDEFLKIIEDEIKKIKGDSFKASDIKYEFIASEQDFSLYTSEYLKPEVKDRIKIYTSDYLGGNWGSVDGFRTIGWKDGSYILGASTHDSKGMRIIYEDPTRNRNQIETLARILKIPIEKLNDYNAFVQAKLAEPMRSFHNLFMFTDVLGINDTFSCHANRADNYRIKISENYQKDYFEKLERGEGFNIMDALDKAFVSLELDKSEKELYEKIVKYKNILQEKEKKLTQKPKQKNIGLIIAAVSAVAVLAGALVFNNKRNKKENLPINDLNTAKT